MRKRLFTLIELLVVITIIAILSSLLLPALARARYQAKTIVCTNNLKEIGVGFTMYCDDYDGFFPQSLCNKNSTCSSWGKVHNRILDKSVQGLSISQWYPVATHYNHTPLLQPYFGGKMGMKGVFMCPHIKNGYDERYSSTTFPYYGLVPYAMFYNLERSSEGIQKAMRKIGDPWQNSSSSNCGDDMYSETLASDRISSGWGGAGMDDGNHIPYGANGTWLQKSNQEIYAWKWSTNWYGNANFLGSDGSVLFKNGIHKLRTDQFGGYARNFLMPAELYYE